MADFITIDSYDAITKETSERTINKNSVVEIVNITVNGFILSRLHLTNNDFLEVRDSVENIVKKLK